MGITRQHAYTFGLLLLAIAIQISGLDHWADAVKPSFVAGCLTAVGAVLRGMFQDPPQKDLP
jgi:hypothetical protein